MDTVNQILPFYDSLTQQDEQRYLTNQVPMRRAPLTTLLPFQIKRAHSASNQAIQSLKLIDYAGNVTELLCPITSWSDGLGYSTTFITSSEDILTAVQAAASASRANSSSLTVVSGATYTFAMNLTSRTGELPTISLADSGFVAKSNIVTLTDGWQTVQLLATGSGTYTLQIKNTTTTSWDLDIQKYALPSIITFYGYTSVDYFQYNGAALNISLTAGYYYLQATDTVNTWYSEWFFATDVSNMIEISFTNSVDVGDILYAHGFTQQVYFDAVMLHDEPKMTVTGDIKDGVLITEKVVTAPGFTIIDWVTPSLLAVLYMINGHTTITVTDDLDNTYSPNNIEVSQAHDIYDLFMITLKFTSGEVVNTLNNTAIA